MKIYNVYGKKNKTFVNEGCVLHKCGNYVGIKTGNVYSCEDYYHREQLNAKIIHVDKDNETGMYHLYKETSSCDEENNSSWKNKFVGCYVTVEQAHWCDDLLVYRCLELNEYFSENEVEIL